MNNYKKSDFALNKYSKGIVYRFATGIIEVSLEDYLAENPDKTVADFEKIKQLSDCMFEQESKDEYNQTRKNILIDSNYQDTISSALIEDGFIEAQDSLYSKAALIEMFKSKTLTETQSRRFIKYIFKGLSLRQIAAQEGVSHIAIYKSIKLSNKKYLSFFSRQG